jgi:cysteine desulfurase / selenocysteine lyase
MPVDVQDLGCDFYVFTGHKVYGPSGIGVLYGRGDLLEAMRPFQGGGEMIEEVTEDASPTTIRRTASRPARRRSCRRSGWAPRSTTWKASGVNASPRTRRSCNAYAHERLSRINSLRIYGDAPGKGSIVSFELQGIHAHDVSMVIDRAGVAVRAGTHCAQPLLKRFGVTSTCRASFAMYNTRAEIDVLAEALEKARKFFG